MKITYLQKNRDGAKSQERAILEMLLDMEVDNAYISPDDEGGEPGNYDKYKTDFALFRFENCREQGYMLLDRTSCLCMIWYEHRNSDSICIARMRSPKKTLQTQDFWAWLEDEKPDADKWNMYEESFSYGEIGKAAHYIIEQFEEEY